MERVAFLLNIREGQQEEYVQRHREVWPQVLRDVEKAGFRQMNIFIAGRQLFLYMEVDDYAKAVHILSDCPESVRWEDYMEPIMESAEGDSYDPANPYPVSLPEVFFWRRPDRPPAPRQVAILARTRAGPRSSCSPACPPRHGPRP